MFVGIVGKFAKAAAASDDLDIDSCPAIRAGRQGSAGAIRG